MHSRQRCLLVNVYASWLALAALAAFLFWREHPLVAALSLALLPAAQWLYIRKFPRLSRLMGYGSVEDVGPAAVEPAPVKVTLYTALGCPFCPLMEQRLEKLRESAGFHLEKIDVTLRPDLLSSQGIRSVPVVDIAGTRLIGLATSGQLAAALEAAARATPR